MRSCDSMSGLGTPEEPLPKYVPAYLLPLLAGCCAAGVPAEVSCRSACQGRPSQQWIVADGVGDTVRLVARHSGKVLDVTNEEKADGALMGQYPWHSQPNQQWRLKVIADAAGPAGGAPKAGAAGAAGKDAGKPHKGAKDAKPAKPKSAG